ncbi:carbohydrate esterase family 16 protein [Glonium stellatum]|uniref:Carbohydrate esterase family 16 protein n=1 Tax=Glonium stellatum TaxID=574774 RepID=A0A8E2ES98_9PEZI|nr:carbohydrate esterase family 16 protein [Glonium stellatum]
MMVKSLVITTAFLMVGLANAQNYFFTFGDSYSQTGFNITSTKPSASNPLGNPTYPGWTTSGGPNWIGYLIENHNKTLTYAYNFAYGGATVNASLVTPYTSTVLSLIDQVKQFSDNVASKPSHASWTATNSLFGVWIGVNDIGNSWWNSGESTLLGEVMDSYFSQMQILFNAGARNFVFLNVPPIDKTPTMLAQSISSQEGEAAVISEFNSLLSSRVSSFASANSGVNAIVVDTQAPFNLAIQNPTTYGAPNASCYNSDGKTCLWFNDYHPGMAIHNLVAKAVATAKNGTFFTGGSTSTRSIRAPLTF